MKRSPDLILLILIAVVVGIVMTGVAQSDLQIAATLQTIFNS
ncbi:MAG TPA: hypothetical protein VLA39_11435 [Marinobacterium sp.]|nr:hypothetical protein [Marinobacterium sp.]